MEQHHDLSPETAGASVSFDHRTLVGSMGAIARLMKRSQGATLEEMMQATKRAANECRTIIRKIIDMGGEIELRSDPANGTQHFRLHN